MRFDRFAKSLIASKQHATVAERSNARDCKSRKPGVQIPPVAPTRKCSIAANVPPSYGDYREFESHHFHQNQMGLLSPMLRDILGRLILTTVCKTLLYRQNQVPGAICSVCTSFKFRNDFKVRLGCLTKGWFTS